MDWDVSPDIQYFLKRTDFPKESEEVADGYREDLLLYVQTVENRLRPHATLEFKSAKVEDDRKPTDQLLGASSLVLYNSFELRRKRLVGSGHH